jgi:hypothetical protein
VQGGLLYRTASLLRRRPGALALLQVPVALTALVDPAPSAGITSALQLILILSIVFPIFVFLSTLSSTSTFALARREQEGQPPTAGEALKQALHSARRWFPAGIVLALLTIPGAFAPILIPVAVYFSAIYGFAPFIAMEQPETPLSVCFHRSKKLVSKALWQMLGIAGALMIIEFAMAFWSSDLGGRVGALATPNWLSTGLAWGTQFGLSLVLSVLINPLLSVFFLKLRSEP